MSAESDSTRAPPSTTEILRIEGLRIEARTDEDSPAKLIVEDVDLVLHRGEVLGLIGESGAGKSTIGLAALGYTRPGCTITGGKILFDGVDLRNLTPEQRRQRRGRRVAYIAQSAAASFNPAKRIYNQICEGPVRHGLMSYEQAQGRGHPALPRARPALARDLRGALSPSGLRRPAPARHGRHGHVLPSRHTGAGRADHGAGCDDPDRGAGLDPQAHPRASRGGALYQPRPRRGGAGGQSDHGAPPRQDGGGGRGRSDPAPAADGLHPRPGLEREGKAARWGRPPPAPRRCWS